ncbi:MAG: transglycosylase domain-containing protein, partial [Alphaproteobacteria bacterium]
KLINALSGIFVIALVGVGAGFALFHHYARDLPDYQMLAEYEPPIVSRVYAADGRLIGEFAAEKRIFVPFDMVPQRVLNAFVAAEDHRFFYHPGFDFRGIIRALRANLAGGLEVQGGSTITQQVAKNILLTPERSLDRKIRELILAVRIERAYSKQKIVEIYLNQIFLGRQAYGVAAAARAYFDKSLDALTVAEAALLAALPQAPSRFNPDRRAAAATARRNYVVQRMLEDGFITDAEAEAAVSAPLGVKPPPGYLSVGAEYFVEEVRREMIAKYGEEKSKEAGYVVRATIDPRLQVFADTALRNGLITYDRRHGWRGPIANLRALHGEDWRDGWRRKLRAVKVPSGNGAWPIAVVIQVEAAGADIAMGDGRSGYIPLSELSWARKQGEIRTEPGKPRFRTAVGPAIRQASDVLKPGDAILVER